MGVLKSILSLGAIALQLMVLILIIRLGFGDSFETILSRLEEKLLALVFILSFNWLIFVEVLSIVFFRLGLDQFNLGIIQGGVEGSPRKLPASQRLKLAFIWTLGSSVMLFAVMMI